MSVVLIPRLNSNEDELLLDSLLVENGDEVDVGQEIAILESTKAVQSINAEDSGKVTGIMFSEGSMVSVGSVLMNIGEDTKVDEIVKETKLKDIIKHQTAGERLRNRRKIKNNLQIDENRPVKIIPSQELDWVIEAQKMLPECVKNKISWDAGDFPETSIADNVILSARSLFIEKGAIIESGVVLDVEEAIIRSGSRIGENTTIQTNRFILSEGAVIGAEVKIDLAGGAFPDSCLFVGPLSLIGGRAMINTCREVLLERESAISPSANLFTHSFWQSMLEGYKANFKPIRLQEKAWIGAGCQILPGVTIGQGAILMSNSTAVEDIPPESMAAGVPATVFKYPIVKKLTLEQQYQRILNAFGDWAQQLNAQGCTSSVKEDCLHVSFPNGSHQSVSVKITDEAILLVLSNSAQFNLTLRQFSGEQNRFTDELRNLLRRRGVRILPDDWDFGYKGDFLL
jgi:acetyltransferase-like isoleucine patch superfamily enzyme